MGGDSSSSTARGNYERGRRGAARPSLLGPFLENPDNLPYSISIFMKTYFFNRLVPIFSSMCLFNVSCTNMALDLIDTFWRDFRPYDPLPFHHLRLELKITRVRGRVFIYSCLSGRSCAARYTEAEEAEELTKSGSCFGGKVVNMRQNPPKCLEFPVVHCVRP